MSSENVKLFYKALGKDKALQDKFKAINEKYKGQKPDEAQADLIYQKELVPLARESGFYFTLAELKDYASEAKKPVMRELSEEELATVAGGKFCACVWEGMGNMGAGSPGAPGTCFCFAGGSGNLDGGKVDCVCVIHGGGG
jgi:hypothetical protein